MDTFYWLVDRLYTTACMVVYSFRILSVKFLTISGRLIPAVAYIKYISKKRTPIRLPFVPTLEELEHTYKSP